jgi:hypothetical protein
MYKSAMGLLFLPLFSENVTVSTSRPPGLVDYTLEFELFGGSDVLDELLREEIKQI